MIFSFCILKSAACLKHFIPMGNNFEVDITIYHSKYSCLQTIKTLTIMATKKKKLKCCVRVYSLKITGAVEA